MKKIVLAPDSFKGTLSAEAICRIIKEEIHRIFPDCQVISVPVADGGEGTCNCFLHAMEGQSVTVSEVSGPFGDSIEASYCIVNQGHTAIIEMAAAAGLPLAGDRKNPMKATSFGVGQLMRHALERGVSEIVLGLGGSATTDGGTGLAAAMGVVFYDETDRPFVPVGETMGNVGRIDVSKAREHLSGIALRAMCDVSNPMYGPRGAAAVFGPQKGADAAMVEALDLGLRHLGALYSRLPGKEAVCCLPGGGAAGGIGAGVYALLSGVLQPGIQVVLDTVGFEELLDGCSLVFTGEGRIDSQSLGGKVISGVASRAAAKGVPVCALVGCSLDDQIQEAYNRGLTAVFPINRQALPFEEAAGHSEEFLRCTAADVLRLLRAATL